jgi:putative lipoic acid-binding regulatory protein
MAEDPSESLVEFPCHFPIKVIGEAHQDSIQIIAQLIKEHIHDFSDKTIESKMSSEGKFISLTCTIYVTSKEQLDLIYKALSAHPMTKFVL